MISALMEMWASGLLIGFGLGIQLARYTVRKADDSLRAANDELQAEVKRLRAFHALHINSCHPADGQADLRTAA